MTLKKAIGIATSAQTILLSNGTGMRCLRIRGRTRGFSA